MTKHQIRRKSSYQTLATLIAVLAVLYLARDVFIPLAFAVTLAFILSPAVTRLVKMHVARTAAALIVGVVSLALAGAIGIIIFNQLIQVVNELPEYEDNIHAKIQAIRAPSQGPLGRATESVRELGKELSNAQPPVAPPPAGRPLRRSDRIESDKTVPVQIVTQPGNQLQYVRDLVQPVLAPLAKLGIVLVFTLYLLIEQLDLRDRLFRLAGLSRMHLMMQALDDATRRVSRYLVLQFLVNACFGALCGLGLYLIGVPYAILWGAVAAILRIIPYIGSPIAGSLPLLLSLAVFNNWMPPLLIFVLFLGLELLIANLIEPWLYGAHTGISSIALLLTTVFWTVLWGPAGLILSTPLTVCLVVLGRHAPQFSFLHVLLGDEPVLAAGAQLYQRLLAMDETGAREIVEQSLAATPAMEVYDSVIIPALTMAERDRHKGTFDSDREEFIFMSLREIIAESAGKIEKAASGRETRQVRILCVPANDEADEIAAAMLAKLLAAAGHTSIAFATDARLQAVLRTVGPTEDDVLCVSALPPFAFAQARSMTVRLRRRFPKTKIIVGVWGFSGDATRAVQRFEPARPDALVGSLASAVEWFNGASRQPDAEPDVQPLSV
ncbi:MAG TPA: AI-2E family transporter [Bryobacteraceae bacterium]|nr:AI-2E family transporter [Bryobacteraceae bacterium]